jgi:hypothetical protein
MKEGANMKKAALGFIALAMSIFTISANAASRTGDIRSIEPCDQYGYVIPNGTIDAPYSAGQTVYFRLRLENLNAKQLWENGDGDLVNPWQFKHISGLLSQEAALAWIQTPPKVGVWVSGSLRYATVHWYGAPEGKKWYTDIVCSYTVQPGDLAFPMALADSNGNKVGVGSASAYKLLNVGGANPWKLVANEYAGASSGAWVDLLASDVQCAFRWANAGSGDNCLDKTYSSDLDAEKTSWKADLSLEQAGLYIKTIDFAASTNSVAQGRSDRVTVNIEGGANTNGNGVVYAKVKKGSVVTLDESSVEEIDMWDGTATNTYQVAKVMIPSGEDVNSFTFKVKGVTQSDEGAVVYLSSTKEFSFDDNYVITTNFVTTIVKCVAPPPPYIKVTLDGEASKSITSSSNYKEYASKLTVTLSEAYTSDVTVEVTPSMVSGTVVPLGKYIAMSSYSENGYTVTNKTVTFTVADMANGVLSKDLYVYVLGADDQTDGVGKGIIFKAGKVAIYDNENVSAILYIKKSTPQILYPAENQS